MSPKHECQHQQTRRPRDHHSQQEPFIGYHWSIPASSRSSGITGTKVTRFHWNRRSPKVNTAGPHQFREAAQDYLTHQRLKAFHTNHTKSASRRNAPRAICVWATSGRVCHPRPVFRQLSARGPGHRGAAGASLHLRYCRRSVRDFSSTGQHFRRRGTRARRLANFASAKSASTSCYGVRVASLPNPQRLSKVR
jgi:hypothetical protein